MANYRAVANGNWNTASTWEGNAVPPNGQGHNIYSNGWTVTIDTNVDVALITNASATASFVGGGTSAVAGGVFTAAAGSYTLNSTTLAGSTTSNATLITSSSPGIISINCQNISDRTSTSLATISNNGIGEISISGCSSMNTGRVELHNTSTGNLRLTSCVISGGSSDNNTYRIRNTSSGNVFISSSTISSTVAIFNSYTVLNSASGGISIENCVIASGTSASGAECIRNASTGSINITNSTLITNLYNVLNNVSSGSLTISASTVTAANGVNAIVSTNASATNRFSGTFISSPNGTQPINATKWILGAQPLNAYIQHARDGLTANSFDRFYTADNSTALNQAAPTDVRSGVAYGIGNSQTGRLTVPARGSVALSVNYGPSMPFTATRSGTTATATLAYSYPLVVGDQITVTGASNSEWNGSYTIASVVSGTSVTFPVPNTHSATAGTGANMQTTGTAVLDPTAVASAVWGAASRTITGGLVDTATTLTNAPSVPSAAQIASQVRTELATELARVDVATSSRLAAADYNAPTSAPTAASVANAVWSAAARTITGGTVDTLTNAPTVPSAAAIATQVWAVADKTGYSLTSAERSAIAAAVEASILNEGDGQAILNAIVTAIGNSNVDQVALVAAIRSDLERNGGKLDGVPAAVRSNLATELGRIDAEISTRLAGSAYTAPANSDIAAIKSKTDALPASPAATGDIPSANIAAIKSKTDLLNTDRLAQCSTVSTTGAQLAAALS